MLSVIREAMFVQGYNYSIYSANKIWHTHARARAHAAHTRAHTYVNCIIKKI